MSDRLIIICLTTSRPTAAGGSKQGLRIQLISLLLSWVGVKNVLVALKGLRLLVWKQLKHTSFQVMQIEVYICILDLRWWGMYVSFWCDMQIVRSVSQRFGAKLRKKFYRVSVNLLFFRLHSFAKTGCLFWGTLPGLALRVAQIGVSDGTKKMLLWALLCSWPSFDSTLTYFDHRTFFLQMDSNDDSQILNGKLPKAKGYP